MGYLSIKWNEYKCLHIVTPLIVGFVLLQVSPLIDVRRETLMLPLVMQLWCFTALLALSLWPEAAKWKEFEPEWGVLQLPDGAPILPAAPEGARWSWAAPYLGNLLETVRVMGCCQREQNGEFPWQPLRGRKSINGWLRWLRTSLKQHTSPLRVRVLWSVTFGKRWL